MSIENPAWRLEIWHEGLKAADIRNDEFGLVVADLVQFEATRREEAEATAKAEAEAEAEAEAAAKAEAEVDGKILYAEDAEEEAADEEVEAFAESPATYWAHFAAAALQRKQTTPQSAATMADELLTEYQKRFSEGE